MVWAGEKTKRKKKYIYTEIHLNFAYNTFIIIEKILKKTNLITQKKKLMITE